MNQVPIYAAEIVRDLLVVVTSINEHAPCRGALIDGACSLITPRAT